MGRAVCQLLFALLVWLICVSPGCGKTASYTSGRRISSLTCERCEKRQCSHDLPSAAASLSFVPQILDQVAASTAKDEYLGSRICPLFITTVLVNGMLVKAAVSQWYEHGSVLEFVHHHPEADRLELVCPGLPVALDIVANPGILTDQGRRERRGICSWP